MRGAIACLTKPVADDMLPYSASTARDGLAGILTTPTDVAIVTNLFTVAKLLPLLLFIGAGLFFLNPQGYSFAGAPAYTAFSASVLSR